MNPTTTTVVAIIGLVGACALWGIAMYGLSQSLRRPDATEEFGEFCAATHIVWAKGHGPKSGCCYPVSRRHDRWGVRKPWNGDLPSREEAP